MTKRQANTMPDAGVAAKEQDAIDTLGAKDNLCAKPWMLSVFQSKGTDPVENLAIEAVLARTLRQNEVIVYLWRNDHTIVIGRNQNAWRECPVDAFEAAGGHVVRRRSGGGAVYHDLGNLNVSFLTRADELDETANVESLVGAVRAFGINAAATGRNDLTIDGMKFSGTAKWTHEGVTCQHATLMVNVDTDELSRWLHPDKRKLAAKGVSSVRSRVRNLSELADTLTMDALFDAVVASCERVFHAPAIPVSADRLEQSALSREREHFASREWRLGASRPFEHRFTGRFAWGGVDVELDVKKGRIAQARVYSDAMDTELAPALAAVLSGCDYEPESVAVALNEASAHKDSAQASCWADVAALAYSALSGNESEDESTVADGNNQ